MKINTNLLVVLLAAGQQQRFGASGKPKCLSQINSATILERIKQKYSEWPTITVVHNNWDEQDRKAVGEVALVSEGCTMGHSLAAGLRAAVRLCGDEQHHALVIDADTYIPPGAPAMIPPWIGAILDPWAWVVILRVPATEMQARYFDKHLISKREYLTREGIRPWIRRTGYLNINAQDDLVAARRLEGHEAH